MNVTFDEGTLFYELYAALLSYVNSKLNVVADHFSDSRGYTATPLEARVNLRNVVFDHRELIDQFIAENPAHLPTGELEIVGSWKNALVGKFFVFRYLSKYTVFFSCMGAPKKAYGVLGLADPPEKIIGPYLPRLITTVLLPFKGKINLRRFVSGAQHFIRRRHQEVAQRRVSGGEGGVRDYHVTRRPASSATRETEENQK